MESHYGIGINNRYALFLDEEGGDDGLANHIKKDAVATRSVGKDVEKKTTLKPKEVPSKATINNNNREDKENRGNDRFSGKRVMDARKAQEGPREDRNNRKNRGMDVGNGGGGGASSQENNNNKPVERSENSRRVNRQGRSDRGGGVGGAGDRGGKGPRTFGNSRPKREFERKSGDDKTGIKPVDKREGGGSHNWGTFEDDIKAEEDKINTSNSDDPKETDCKVETTEATEEADETKDNGPVMMTLDEWKAQQAQKNAPKWNIRKAGEGSEIDPKWKKTYAYRKEKEVHEDDDDDEESELYPQRVNRQKRVLDIEFSFTDNASQRGGRDGGRGRGSRGGRGGGGMGPLGDRQRNGEDRRERRGPPRGDSGPRRGGRGGSFTAAPNVNDEASFPTLGIRK